MGILARATADELAAAWARTGADPSFRWLRRPETGMVMVRGRVGGSGRAFNLGEVSVVRCALEVEGGAVGLCYAHGRGHRHAEYAALFDALLQDPVRAHELERDVIAPLEREQRLARERRARDAGATRVDFFTMVRGEDAAGEAAGP